MSAGAASAGSHPAWESIYADRGADGLSWAQTDAERKWQRELIGRLATDREAPIIDVGGGASALGCDLVADGFRDVTVLDTSVTALRIARDRCQLAGRPVRRVCADLLGWRPERRYRVWHDRAVFHFLTGPDDRERYRRVLTAALEPGGVAVLRTFALDGPDRCSERPVRRYDAEQLAAALGSGFALVEHGRESHLTPAGIEQRFVWAVLRRGDAVS